MHTFQSDFVVADSLKQEFVNLLQDEHHKSRFLSAIPEYTNIRSALTEVIRLYLGDMFVDDEFHVFVGKHGYYPAHVDMNKMQKRMCYARFNLLLVGSPGQMQFYETLDDYTDKTWRESIPDTASLKPIERVQMQYPAFVRTDILHDVHFNRCDKGKDRILLSYPFYDTSWEQICEKFNR